LNPDPWFLFTLGNPNTPFLPNSLGTLDSQGKQTTVFQVPPVPIPSLIGTLMHHAFVVANASGTSVELASNAVPVTLVQ